MLQSLFNRLVLVQLPRFLSLRTVSHACTKSPAAIFMSTRKMSAWLLVTNLLRLLPPRLRLQQLVALVVVPPMPCTSAMRRTKRLLRLAVRQAWPRSWELQPWVRGRAR